MDGAGGAADKTRPVATAALKIFRGLRHRDRWAREVAVMRTVTTATEGPAGEGVSVARLLEAFEDDTKGGVCCLVMTPLFDHDLRSAITAYPERPYPLSVAVQWAADTAVTLGHLRQLERNFIHRDLHPTNVFIASSSGRVRIGDFGMALVGNLGLADPIADEEIPEPEPPSVWRVGQEWAPEATLGGEYGPASEIWALGVLLASILLRRTDPLTVGDVNAVTAAARVAWGGERIPSGLLDLLEGMLRERPQDRPSLETVVTGVTAALTEIDPPMMTTPPPEAVAEEGEASAADCTVVEACSDAVSEALALKCSLIIRGSDMAPHRPNPRRCAPPPTAVTARSSLPGWTWMRPLSPNAKARAPVRAYCPLPRPGSLHHKSWLPSPPQLWCVFPP
jgi:serine/threonine protein kinase